MGITLFREFHTSLRLIDELLALVFQTQCLSCRTAGVASALCPRCAPGAPLSAPVCSSCGDPVPAPIDRCGRCVRERLRELSYVRSGLWLTEPAREVVHRVKYGGRFELLDLFREWVSWKQDRPPYPDSVVMAVPSSVSTLLARGFHLAGWLADRIAESGGLERARKELCKTRETPSQTGLKKVARRRNLRGAFEWTLDVAPPHRVLLVDDIFTTGATLEACARGLRRSGCREVIAWTLFRTPRLGSVAPLAGGGELPLGG